MEQTKNRLERILARAKPAWHAVAWIAAIAAVAACLLGISPSDAKADSEDEEIVGEMIGKASAVGTMRGDTTYHVMRFEGSDALYLMAPRYNIIVPFLDGDGTPVTYDEWRDRLGYDGSSYGEG